MFVSFLFFQPGSVHDRCTIPDTMAISHTHTYIYIYIYYANNSPTIFYVSILCVAARLINSKKVLHVMVCVAQPFSPYSIQKRPEPQICPKFVPAIVWGVPVQNL